MAILHSHFIVLPRNFSVLLCCAMRLFRRQGLETTLHSQASLLEANPLLYHVRRAAKMTKLVLAPLRPCYLESLL